MPPRFFTVIWIIFTFGLLTGCATLSDRPVGEQLAGYSETGEQAYGTGDFPKARGRWETGLELARQHDNEIAATGFLIDLARLAESTGDYQGALARAREGLVLAETLNAPGLQGKALSVSGLAYRRMGQYRQARRYSRKARAIAQRLNDTSLASESVRNLGAVRQAQGDFDVALELYQEALALARDGDDAAQEAMALNNIGGIHRARGAYEVALENYRRSLELREGLGDRPGQSRVLGNICLVYETLNQIEQALDYCQRALAIARQIGDRARQANHLNNIGGLYRKRGEFSQALEYYQRSAALKRELGDRAGEARSLNNIGELYIAQGDMTEALRYLSQSLRLKEALGDRSGASATHYNLGLVYRRQQQYAEALSHFERALVIQFELGEPELLWRLHDDLSRLHATLGNVQMAIFHGKLAVATLQSVRAEIRDLDPSLQRSYLTDKANVYKHLAGLLLDQERVLEAQRVLDLLKVQELKNYLGEVRGGLDDATPWHPLEQPVVESYRELQKRAVALGRKLDELRQIPRTERTPEQEQRIRELHEIQVRLMDEFDDFIESPAVLAMVDGLSREARRHSIDLEDLIGLRDNLRRLQQNAVLLYPLILEDRLELVLATPYSPPIRRSVAVKRQDLNQAVGRFRDALGNSHSDVKPLAQQFYDWLIKPIESDLAAANARTIIYAPDGILRYVPLAAAYDGEHWLVQRFRIYNITARSLFDLDTQPQPRLEVLAGAFTQGNYTVAIDQGSPLNFSGLRFAGVEVETLATMIPATERLLNEEFKPDTMIPRMNDYTVVHLATHAAFLVGQPEDSFILFGNGERVSLQELKRWNFTKVDLVVLSACETGVGGRLGNGEEILGFGYLMQRAGARASLASLWSVSDGGTQALMTAFYGALKGGASKAEALRQSQLSLIAGDYHTLEDRDRGVVIALEREIRRTVPPEVYGHLSHPFYWAPFILIGNGL